MFCQKSLDFSKGKSILCRKCVKGFGVLSEENPAGDPWENVYGKELKYDMHGRQMG